MGQNELVAHPHLQLLSWSVNIDFDWPNVISHYHPHEVNWIEFSESIGLICEVSSNSSNRPSFGIDTVKASGILLLIGFGSWLCCKFFKFYYSTVTNRSFSSSSSEGPPGKFGSLFKTSYFGPANTDNDELENDRRSFSPGKINRPEYFSFIPFKKGVKSKSETGSCLLKSSPLRYLYSTNSSPILNGKGRLIDYDSSISLLQELSSDNISEMSLDYDNSTTFARLDRLQQEIDQIKDSCQSMDEEFVTIRGSRNLPGLSNLMEAGELKADEQTEEHIQKARKCFKGLYSLTTINHSISLELANYPTTPPIEEEIVKDSNKINQSMDEEALPSLEWDESADLNETNISLYKNDVICDTFDSAYTDSLQSSQIMADNMSISEFDKEDMFLNRSPSFESSNGSCYTLSEISSSDQNDYLSIGPKVDIISYAKSEWKGSSIKAEKIIRGYTAAFNDLKLKYLQRIRGDNYCAIRATIFQVLSLGLSVPSAQQVYNILSQESHTELLKIWKFARLPKFLNNINEGIHSCLIAFDQLTADIAEKEDKSSALLNVLNADYLLDIKINEAVKLLMLERSIQLFNSMIDGDPVPDFAMLMFARDTSCTVEDLLCNHLCKIGDSGGLEMVEMYLLAHTLKVSIRVVRPSSYGNEDFVCFYSEENSNFVPQITLIAEDDRHYNILVQ